MKKSKNLTIERIPWVVYRGIPGECLGKISEVISWGITTNDNARRCCCEIRGRILEGVVGRFLDHLEQSSKNYRKKEKNTEIVSGKVQIGIENKIFFNMKKK